MPTKRSKKSGKMKDLKKSVDAKKSGKVSGGGRRRVVAEIGIRRPG